MQMARPHTRRWSWIYDRTQLRSICALLLRNDLMLNISFHIAFLESPSYCSVTRHGWIWHRCSQGCQIPRMCHDSLVEQFG